MRVTGAKWILCGRMNDPQEDFIGDIHMQKRKPYKDNFSNDLYESGPAEAHRVSHLQPVIWVCSLALSLPDRICEVRQ